MKSLEGAENVKVEVKGDRLLIEVSLKHRGKVTANGNARISSTLGNKEIPGTSGAMCGLNIYIAAAATK